MVKKKEPERLSRRNLDDAIHTIFKDKDAQIAARAEEKDGATFYTAKGLGDFKDKEGNHLLDKDGPDCCSQKKTTSGVTRYFIKFDGHTFYNPSGMYSQSDRGAKKVPGLQKWRFTAVSKSVFLSYLRFLNTRKQVHLEHALREFS